MIFIMKIGNLEAPPSSFFGIIKVTQILEIERERHARLFISFDLDPLSEDEV